LTAFVIDIIMSTWRVKWDSKEINY
jgi:hypothetical protein